MKVVKTKGEPMEQLYVDMVRRIREAGTRVQAVAAMGNKAAMLAEARALLGQCSALVELLEGELREGGRLNVDS